jgi:hypothetical protein
MVHRPDPENRGRQLSPGPLQSIEPIGPDDDIPPPGADASSWSFGEAPPAPEPAAPEPLAPFAGRFRSAASALLFAAQLLAAGRGDQAGYHRVGDGDGWWVTAEVELSLGRELALATNGEPFVQVQSRLVRDRGWGPPPTGAGATTDDVDPADLREVGLLELVRVAGLHRAAEQPLETAVVLLPGILLQQIGRRALDLRLEAQYRPVRLSPLLEGTTGTSTVFELTLRQPDGHLPASFLRAVADSPFTVVCRSPDPAGRLLIQHGMASPLPDHELAAIVDAGTWVLAGAHFGCWRLDSAGAIGDAASLLEAPASVPLDSGAAIPDGHAVEKIRIRVVRGLTRGARVDGVLLDDGDLAPLAILLEGHPLADLALLVPGRDRHLLIAPGGLLERLPVGEPLYCLGPGPLYLPLGQRLQPRLPASARRTLLPADERTGLVLLLGGPACRFRLDERRPVWTLWVGDPPPVDEQLPRASVERLSGLDQPTVFPPKADSQPAADPPRRGVLGWFRNHFGEPESPPTPAADWRAEALEAELRGDLIRAAELHEHHGDHLRAGNLFERAARAAGPGG